MLELVAVGPAIPFDPGVCWISLSVLRIKCYLVSLTEVAAIFCCAKPSMMCANTWPDVENGTVCVCTTPVELYSTTVSVIPLVNPEKHRPP